MATITYPLDSITYDTVTTGAYTDIKVGQTVLLGSAAGLDDLGRQRVRKTPTSTVLYVGRSSQGIHDGELNVSDNMYITVVNDFRVWAKIQFIDVDDSTNPPTSTIYKDSDIVVSTNTSAPPPVANCGPGTCATTSAGIITVQFVGTNSFAVANGASISTYLWDVADGTITVGTSASSTITATFPAGFRWVSLTVTDSNSKTHTARCPVYARNSASDTTIPNWQIESHRITPAGQQVSVKVLSSIPVTTYPDGTLAMIFDGEPASSSDRSHMLFIGWHHTDPALIAAQRTGTLKDTTLNLLDVAGKLDTLPGFPQSVERNASPTLWTQMSNTNVDRLAHYMLHWHSTALDLADWTNSGTGDTYPFVRLERVGETLWNQVTRLAKNLVPNYVLGCNTLGQMTTKVDPMLQDTGSRTSTVQATLAISDWSNLRFTHQRPGRYHWLRANAILASTSTITPLFCVSPGEAPAQGETAVEQGEQLAASQSALNSQEGHRYARLNAPESHFAITLAQGDDLDIEPANMTWVRLTISSAVAAQRGLTFTTARGLVHEINIRYDHRREGLVRTVELDWEREVTSGLAATTDTIPTDLIPEEEFTPPPNGYDWLPGPPEPTITGATTVFVMTQEQLFRTTDFNVASPTWTDISPYDTAGANHFCDFILDPWAPATTGYLISNNSSHGIYKSTNLNTATPTWTLKLSWTDAETAASVTFLKSTNYFKLLASSNVQNWIFTQFVDGAGNVYTVFSTNGGTSWTLNVTGIDLGAATYEIAAFDIMPTPGSTPQMFIVSGSDDVLTNSTDLGQTWNSPSGELEVYTGDPCNVLICPTQADPDHSLKFYFGTNDGANGGGVLKAVYDLTPGIMDPVTVTDISPNGDKAVKMKRGGVHVFGASTRLYAWIYTASHDREDLYISDNDGSSWTAAAMSGFATTSFVEGFSVFPYDKNQLYALSASDILYSSDAGATWTSKKGSLVFGASEFTNRNGVIVPLWTQ